MLFSMNGIFSSQVIPLKLILIIIIHTKAEIIVQTHVILLTNEQKRVNEIKIICHLEVISPLFDFISRTLGEGSKKRQLIFIISMEKSTSHGPGLLFLKEFSIGT